MSIWYLHHYSGHPGVGMSYRPYYLAKALKEMNTEMIVFGASFHHLKNNDRVQNTIAELEFVDGIPYCWVKTCRYKGNNIRRILNMLQFAFLLLFINPVSRFKLDKPKHIIVSSAHPFHIVAGWYYSKRFKTTLSFEIRDLWPLSLVELLGISRFHPLCLLVKIFEVFAYRVSDLIISVLPNSLDYLAKYRISQKDFLYIPNGILESSVGDMNALSNEDQYTVLKMENICKSFSRVMLYAGAHGIPNNLIPLIESMRFMSDNYALVLVGDGNSKNELKSLKASYGLNNVFFLDKVSKPAIPLLINQADLCVLIAHNAPLYKFGVSMNKLFDYMLGAKPIFFAIDSPNNVVEISGCGVSSVNQEPVVIAKHLTVLLSLSNQELNDLGQKGRKYVIKHHSFTVLARELLLRLNKIGMNK